MSTSTNIDDTSGIPFEWKDLETLLECMEDEQCLVSNICTVSTLIVSSVEICFK